MDNEKIQYEQLAARARKYQRKLKNTRLEKHRKHKSIERKAIILYLRNKNPEEILKYIESDDTRSIYYYPEQYAEIDNYDLMKLNWETRYNLWKRLLFPPRKNKWRILSKQLYESLITDNNASTVREMLNNTICRSMLNSEHKGSYTKLLKKIYR